ncbi:hypothetical protein ABZP36_000379 [Zizania latifolia]
MATTDGQRFCGAHPQHLLLETRYDNSSRHACHICQAGLSGDLGYRCNACEFDIHEACADHFNETMPFFAHPWHTLTLSRIQTSEPSGNDAGVVTCDICREECTPGSFVYRCVPCAFDVHPLCMLLPQTIKSPLHQQHELTMVPATGRCAACLKDIHVWHYRCGPCRCTLHIWCVDEGSGDRSHNTSDDDGAIQTASDNDQNTGVVAVMPRRRFRVAKFLFKTTCKIVINMAAGGVPVFDIFEAVFT